jgi:hypothetical protein
LDGSGKTPVSATPERAVPHRVVLDHAPDLERPAFRELGRIVVHDVRGAVA